ncbi:MAG: hydrogenase maturation nickel metallochaperone HypA [Methylococcaceae bacterium]
MHELSLCDDLLSQVVAIAAQHNAQSVESITLQIGALAGVEPALLETAFALIRVGTVAEQAELIMQTVPVTVLCQLCGTQSEVVANLLLCNACQSHETSLLSGDQLILASVALNCAD